ncbi:MAG: dihydrofolate reductase family protein [Stackebrandtia sp.]
MSAVVVDISMSLDGFVAAPGVDLEHGLGVGGEVIHNWVLDGRTDADDKVLDDAVAATGAVVMGRRLFDIVDGPHGWNDDMGYGAERGQSISPPYFVVTHQAPTKMRLSGDFTFVTGGVTDAVEQAKAAAGDKDVMVMGGASVSSQCVAAGLADEVRIHLAPVLLGGGTRLFDHLGTGTIALDVAKVVETPQATHLFYRVAGK